MANPNEPKTDTAHHAHGPGSIIVDLGRRKKKQIKLLRKGKGKLIGEVHECIKELQTSGALKTGGQPVILVVRESDSAKGCPLCTIRGR
jgi:hypothetical protein